MVAPVAHITQQTFMIGQFAIMEFYRWLRHPWQYLNQYPPSPNETSTRYTSSHRYSSGISEFPYQSLGMHYQKYKSMCKITVGVKTISSVGVAMISKPILTPTPPNYHHNHIFQYSIDHSPHFFHGEPWSCGIKTTRPEKQFW